MRAILWSTLVAGALDISAAIILRGTLNGMAASRVLQSVASGVLGRDAFGGGLPIAALGLLVHFLVMVGIATVFYLASRKLPLLTNHWIGFGLVYGAIAYLMMSFVIVPLSAFPGKLVPSVAAFVEGIVVHMICVGLPIAYFTSRYSQPAN